MNGETISASPPAPSLVERISTLEPGSNETQSEFLGRAAALTWEFEDHVLDHRELDYVREFLPGWDFSPGKLRSFKFIRATRLGPATSEQVAVLPTYKSDRRVVAQDKRSSNIVVLAQNVLKGSDVACILEIEAVSSRNQAQAKSPPKVNARSHNISGRVTEVSKLDETTGLALTETERETLNLQAFSLNEISRRLDVDKSAVSKRITFAIERNNMSREEFLDRAVAGNLIDMSPLLFRRDYSLSENEVALLKDHIFKKHADIARDLGLESTDEVSKLKKSINKKFRLVKDATPTRIYLIAKRDKVI